MSQRIAIVLFNLGGPDGPEAIRPFLQNLFSDPAIIRAPAPFRWILARLIARRRTPIAREIYEKLGGRSPILPQTEAQARALEAALGEGYKCFIAMRYWHPRAREIVQQLNAFQPDRLVLLPLYPQYSSTTTRSSLEEFWREVQQDDGWVHANWDRIKISSPCCYPVEPGFVQAQAELIRPLLDEAGRQGRVRLLFSAHGLPEKVIAAGDPYQWQCEQTAQAIMSELKQQSGSADVSFDWLNCYQSRVGPLKWIGPATDDEIRRAGHEKVPVVLVPIAFVGEHSETLVELDIEYRELAQTAGVPFYGRVPAVGIREPFIQALAALVSDSIAGRAKKRLCPSGFSNCPCRSN